MGFEDVKVEVEEVDLSFVNMPVDKNDMFVIVFLQNDQYLDITTKVKDIISNQITFSSETPVQSISMKMVMLYCVLTIMKSYLLTKLKNLI